MSAKAESASRYLQPQAVIADKYRLEAQLAEGGMGSVWVASNMVLEHKVAIKVLHSDQLNELAEARLLREARAAAKIGHANIVQVFDFGHIRSGEPFIVMELLEGEDLAARLTRQGRLSAVEAAKIMLPIASALAAGHAKGIVHRDLKPGNVFLAVDDIGNETPKVVDFGIAKVDVAAQFSPKLTMEGRVIGSPEYLSPEQARGDEDLEVTTDVWAFGVTLYESVTGDLPFHDENYNRLLRRIIEEEPRPITDYAAGDKALWDIISRALSKQRRNRWQSMEDLGRALEAWLQHHRVSDIPRVRFPSVTTEHALGAGAPKTTPSSDDSEPTLLRMAPPIPGPPPSFAGSKQVAPLPPEIQEALAKHGSPVGNDSDELPTRVVSPGGPKAPPPVHTDPNPSRVEAPPVYGDTRSSGTMLGTGRVGAGKLAGLVAGGLALGSAIVVLIVLVVRMIPTEAPTVAPATSATASGAAAPVPPTVQPEPEASQPAPPREPAAASPAPGSAAASASAPPSASSSSPPPAAVPRPPRPAWKRPYTPPIPTEPNF